MATFAVLDGETVINLIVADSKEDAESVSEKTCVEYVVPEIGYTYTNETFVKP